MKSEADKETEKIIIEAFGSPELRPRGKNVSARKRNSPDFVEICTHGAVAIIEKHSVENPESETPKYGFVLDFNPDDLWLHFFRKESPKEFSSYVQYRILWITSTPSSIQHAVVKMKQVIERVNELYIPASEAIRQELARQEEGRKKIRDEREKSIQDVKNAFDGIEI